MEETIHTYVARQQAAYQRVSDDITKRLAEANATKGRKDDGGKLRWGLLRGTLTRPLEYVIKVLMFGADKYGKDNWTRVDSGPERYRDALDRHLAELDKGEFIDRETGLPHMAHVITNALFLLWLQIKNKVV